MNAIFPVSPVMSYSYIKRLIGGKTAVVESASGREQRASYWLTPRWQIEFPFVALTEDELLIIAGFMAMLKGAWDTFYFPDKRNRVAGQVLGTGTGVSQTFQLSRNYSELFTEYPVFPDFDLLGYGAGGYVAPGMSGFGVAVAPTPYIYYDGVLQTSGYTIDSTGLVTAPPGAGVVVTADFDFYYLCRFKDDGYGFEWNGFRYKSDSLVLITVKP